MDQDLSAAYHRAWRLIENAQKITLLTHYKPDGDGVSACAALSSMCHKLGKTYEAIYPCAPEFDYVRRPMIERIASHSFIPDLIIACDTANYDRLYFPGDFSSIPLINIDHHVSNDLRGIVNIVDPDAASVCLIVYELIISHGLDFIDEFVASSLLCGILYDTQVFHTSSTDAKTLRIAADLIDRGAPLHLIKDELIKHKNPQIIHMWGDFLRAVTVDERHNVAWAAVTQEQLMRNGLTTVSLIGFNNFLAEISNIDMTILFYETSDGKVKVSLRSKLADVNQLAQRFGGGGHKRAAGILTEQPLATIVQSLLSAIRQL